MHPHIDDPRSFMAVTCRTGPAIGACELSYMTRMPIDCRLALRQHAAYVHALASLGLDVVTLDGDETLPDATFVEDIALVFDDVAVITSPIASRRRETGRIHACLAAHRRLETIAPPARLEGGDVVLKDRTLYVGQSRRTDRRGLEELSAIAAAHGYLVRPVRVPKCLHLSTGASYLGGDTFLINPAWIDPFAFGGARVLAVPEDEPWAANVLQIAGSVVVPSSNPRTCELLSAEGYSVVSVDISELLKAEGGVTCLSLTFRPALTPSAPRRAAVNSSLIGATGPA